MSRSRQRTSTRVRISKAGKRPSYERPSLSAPMATIIDGKAVAAGIRETVKQEAEAFANETGRRPGLATVLVGDDPASGIYVGGKQKASKEAGIEGFDHRLGAD